MAEELTNKKRIVTKEILAKHTERAKRTFLTKGDYDPDTAVGTADELAKYSDESGLFQDKSFKIQTTADGSDCGSLAKLTKLKGNSLHISKISSFTEKLNQGNSERWDDWDGNCYIDSENENIVRYKDFGNIEAHFRLMDMVGNNFNFYSTHRFVQIIKYRIHDAACYRETLDEENNNVNIGMFYTDIDGNTIPITEKNGTLYIISYPHELIPFHCIRIDLINSLGSQAIAGPTLPGQSAPDFTIDENEILFEVLDYAAFDLTETFGAGFEPLTLESFQKVIKDPFALPIGFTDIYTQPTKLINTSYNQNDEQYATEGEIILEYPNSISAEGYPTENGYSFSKNFIEVLPNKEYGLYLKQDFSELIIAQYDKDFNIITDAHLSNQNKWFTTTGNTHYVKLIFKIPQDTSLEDIQISLFLAWDHSKITYEPHQTFEYPLGTEVLRECNGVRDEKTPDGNIIRRVGVVLRKDLPYQITYENILDININPEFINSFASYVKLNNLKLAYLNLKVYEYEGELCIDRYDENQDAHLDLLQPDDEIFSYVLAEPVIEIRSTYEEEMDIDDFGTMKFIDAIDETLPIIIKQPCEIIYDGSYVAFLDTLSKRVNFDANQIATLSDIGKDDKDFILNGHKVCEEPVHVLISAYHKSQSPHRYIGDRRKRSMKPVNYIETKKCNNMTGLEFRDIKTLIEEYYNLKIEFQGQLKGVCDKLNIDKNEIWTHDDNRQFTTASMYMSQNLYNGDHEYYDSIQNPEDTNAYIRISWSADGHHGLPSNFYFRIDDAPEGVISKQNIKPQVFKFVKNFKLDKYEYGWTGVMANEGIKMHIYILTSLKRQKGDTYQIRLLFIPEHIILK